MRPVVEDIAPDVRVLSLHFGPHALDEIFTTLLVNGYQQKLMEYHFIDLRMLRHCLQRTATVFCGLDPFSMTGFVVSRLEAAGSRNWMASPAVLKRTLVNIDFAMPDIVEIRAKIIGVWPLKVSHLKETGR